MDGDKAEIETVDKSVDKSSRFLDSLNEEVKELKDIGFNSLNLPPKPNNQLNSAEVVQKSGLASENLDRLGDIAPHPETQDENSLPLIPGNQGASSRPSGTLSPGRGLSNNGWHDVIDAPLEGKLERLGVFPQIYGQIAEAVRGGSWTVEQVKELADEVLDIGAGPGVFVFRLKNRVQLESQAEKAEKRRSKFVDAYLAQQEAKNGA